MADVFLSYASEDRARVLPLVRALEQSGFSVWWDREIQPGLRFETIIESELNDAKCVVAVWSSHSVNSSWVYNEASVGLENNNLVPLQIDDVRPPLAFRHLNTASLLNWSSSPNHPELEMIVRSIRRTIEGSPKQMPQAKTSAIEHTISTSRILIASLAILTGLFFTWSFFDNDEAPSIAILDFDNNEPGDGSFLAPGIGHQVRNLLTRTSQVRVTARSLSSTSRDLLNQLNVDYLLEGSVLASDESIQVDVHLVDLSSGLRAWSNQYTKPRTELLELGLDIAHGTLRAMDIELENIEFGALPNKPNNSQSYETYLEVSSLLTRLSNEDTLLDAASRLQQVLEQDPSFAPAYAGLCSINVHIYRRNRDVGYFEKATRQCQRALELDSYLPDAYGSLGNLYSTNGEYDKAIEAYTRAVNLMPNDPDMALGLGDVLLLTGEPLRAEQWFQRAQAIDPGYWRIYESLGSLRFGYGRYDESAAAYLRATELNPHEANCWAGLSAARTMLSDFDGALTASQTALSLEPSAMALSNTATASYFASQLDQAEALYRQALNVEPENHLLWGNLGETLSVLGNSDAAIAAFSNAEAFARRNLAINAQDPELLSRLATYLAYLPESSDSDAIEFIVRALNVAPHDPYVEYDAALTYLRLGDPIAAREHLDKARELGYPAHLVQADPQLSEIR